MPDLFATDGLTVALGLAAASAFLLHTLLTLQSLVHPILLGRQSDVDRVRKPGESALYRNYGTGLMSSRGVFTLGLLVLPLPKGRGVPCGCNDAALVAALRNDNVSLPFPDFFVTGSTT